MRKYNQKPSLTDWIAVGFACVCLVVVSVVQIWVLISPPALNVDYTQPTIEVTDPVPAPAPVPAERLPAKITGVSATPVTPVVKTPLAEIPSHLTGRIARLEKARIIVRELTESHTWDARFTDAVAELHDGLTRKSRDLGQALRLKAISASGVDAKKWHDAADLVGTH